jgi:hypothetical protein
MRRYFFYFAAAMAAFGFSLLIVFSLFIQKRELPVIVQQLPENKPEIREQNLPKVESSPVPDFEETNAFEVLKPTIRKWLKGKKIKSVFTEVSDESIKEITGKNKSELDGIDLTWFSYLRFEPTLLDANNDGKKELAIRNNCAPVGNCEFIFLEKKGNGYNILLDLKSGSVQTFKLQKNKTNGYFDLETKDHGDAWSGGINIYKFDGKKYKVAECFDYNYSTFKDGKIYELNKPKITRRECVRE